MLARAGARALRAITPVGRSLLLLALAATVFGRWGGYAEWGVIAVMCLVVWGLSGLLVLVPVKATAELRLRPDRITAGQPATGTLTVTHLGRLPLPAPELTLPGPRWLRLRLPRLLPRRPHAEKVSLDAPRRGVFEIGPPRLVRTDPLGLFRRSTVIGRSATLFVRPRILALPSLGPSLVRDLEGVPSDRVSMSDLAFHALREYIPGDDLRHVHWRSSARAGELLVRQYHDTRRTQVTVVLDTDRGSYTGSDGSEEFETAVSAAASVLMAAALEDYELCLVAGSAQAVGAGTGAAAVLDETCRVALDGTSLTIAAQVARGLAPDTALLLIVTGAARGRDECQAAAAVFAPDVSRVVLQVALGEPGAHASHRGLTVGTLGQLAELPALWSALTRTAPGAGW